MNKAYDELNGVGQNDTTCAVDASCIVMHLLTRRTTGTIHRPRHLRLGERPLDPTSSSMNQRRIAIMKGMMTRVSAAVSWSSCAKPRVSNVCCSGIALRGLNPAR